MITFRLRSWLASGSALLVALATIVLPDYSASAAVIGGVNLGNLTDNLFVFTDGNKDANWQGASKGFVGDVAVNGLTADERTSGTVPYAGTIRTSAATLGAWQSIVTNNAGQATGLTNQVALLTGLQTNLASAFTQINALSASAGYTSIAPTSLNGLNTTGGGNQTFVINVTSGFNVSTKINITGDAGDTFILRWDTDANFADGYEGQVKFQSGGGIVPLGGLTAANFIHVAGDISSSGGGTNPAAPYPQGPRLNEGTGALITGGSDFNGGGFFTGYWLTTGSPSDGETSSLSNAIFVGGWYSSTTKFSMTSGTSGIYIGYHAPEPGAATLLLLGIATVGALRRRQTKRAATQITQRMFGVVIAAILLLCTSAPASAGFLGTAADFALLGIGGPSAAPNSGEVTINSATSLTGDVGYGRNVKSTTNQKIDSFIGKAFVHSTVAPTGAPGANWDYAAATYQPTLGIQYGSSSAAVDTKLDLARTDALAAAGTLNGLSATASFGATTTNLLINSLGPINVIDFASMDYNGDTLTLASRVGFVDTFVLRVAGSFDFSKSTVTLTGTNAGHVLWYFPNATHILLNKAETIFNGTILAPNTEVEYHNPAIFNGAIIAKDINVHSDFRLTYTPYVAIHAPEPSGLMIAAIGATMGLFVRRRGAAQRASRDVTGPSTNP